MAYTPWKVSPLLFLIAKILLFFSDAIAEPESSLLKGIAAFLEVLTVYLISKGIILRLGE